MLFDLDSLINFIKINNEQISIISLQFSPEYQKNFQEDLYEKIKSLLPKDKKIFIIGDTSYSQCCCDESTALHLKSDIIIRIGTSCFTQNKKMPIYYLIDNLNFTSEEITQFKKIFFENLEKKLESESGKNISNLIFFYNEKFQKNLIFKIKEDIQLKIKEKYGKNIFIGEINIEDYDKMTKNKIIYDDKDILYGRHFIPKLDKKIDETFLLIYLGLNDEEKLLYELSLRYSNKINDILFFNYIEEKKEFKGEILSKNFSSKLLYKRFNLIEKTKECNTFGILIGSLSIPNLNRIINLLKSLLESQDKKVYTLLLGKITEEKLANFIEYIDAFILIGCPFNQGYNSKAIDKIIITPLDVKYAFDENYSWDGFYSFDIDYILINDQEIKDKLEIINTQKEKEIEDIKKKIKENINNENALQKIDTNQALAPIFSFDVLEKYEMRKFKGLQIHSDEPEFNEVKKAIKGKKGIPIKYNPIE